MTCPYHKARFPALTMLRSIWSISSLLIGMGLLLIGSGLLSMIIGLRGVHEGFSDLMIGLIMSGYYGGYIAGGWICPILIRRVGHVRCFASFAAISAILTLSFGLVADPWIWLLLRVFNGLALMGIYMVIESWLNERSQTVPGSQASIFAVYMIVNLAAVAAGQYLITFYGANALESFILAAILFCMGLLPIALTPVPQPLPIATPNLSLGSLARRTPTGVAGALCSGLVLGAFWALTAIYGRALNFSDIDIANFTAMAILGGALTQWPIGWLSDHCRDRREMLIAIAAGATLVLGGLSMLDVALKGRATPNDYVMIAFLLGIFMFSIYGMAVAQTHDRFPASEALEAARGLLLLHGVGAAIGPLASGLAMQYLGTDGLPQSMALFTFILAVFVWWRVHHDAPVPMDERLPFHAATDQVSPVGVEMDPRADSPLTDAQPADHSLQSPSPEDAASAAALAVALAQTAANEAAAAQAPTEADTSSPSAKTPVQDDTNAPADSSQQAIPRSPSPPGTTATDRHGSPAAHDSPPRQPAMPLPDTSSSAP